MRLVVVSVEIGVMDSMDKLVIRAIRFQLGLYAMGIPHMYAEFHSGKQVQSFRQVTAEIYRNTQVYRLLQVFVVAISICIGYRIRLPVAALIVILERVDALAMQIVSPPTPRPNTKFRWRNS